MLAQTTRIRPIHGALLAALLFFVAGQAFVPRTGVEADEALPFVPLLAPKAAIYIRILGHNWPVLLMPYLGTLKSLIYKPLIGIFGDSLWTLREPVLVAGAASILLFFLILRRVSGELAALIGCGLLATDSIYLLTVCYDWGPVALQHLLLLGGVLLILQFTENRRQLSLAAGFFLFGLALWDKALSVWLLSSMGVACCLIFPRKILSLITPRRLAIALVAFVLGAFPLIRYNLKTHWSTFRGNVNRDAQFYKKFPHLVYTLDGRGMFGFMMPFPGHDPPSPHPAADAITATSDKISSLAGHPIRDWMLYALAAALPLTLFARGRDLRTILFCLVVLVGGWLEMAITANAGASVHHTILLWPLPQAIVAVSLAAASARLGRAGRPAVVVAAALMISNALVMNEYYAVLHRDGGLMSWSAGILRLSDYLKTAPPARVYCTDWGILEPLRYLNSGKLQLVNGTDPIVKPALDGEDQKRLEAALDAPDQLVVMHTQEAEEFIGIRARLLRFAEEHGYNREVVAGISDGFGRQMFEVCKFSRRAD